jgi:hypothetical protein
MFNLTLSSSESKLIRSELNDKHASLDCCQVFATVSTPTLRHFPALSLTIQPIGQSLCAVIFYKKNLKQKYRVFVESVLPEVRLDNCNNKAMTNKAFIISVKYKN